MRWPPPSNGHRAEEPDQPTPPEDWDAAWSAWDDTEAPREPFVSGPGEAPVPSGADSDALEWAAEAFLPPDGEDAVAAERPGAAEPRGDGGLPHDPAVEDTALDHPALDDTPAGDPASLNQPDAGSVGRDDDPTLPRRAPTGGPEDPTAGRPVIPDFDPTPYEAIIPEDQRLEIGPDGRPRLRDAWRPDDVGSPDVGELQSDVEAADAPAADYSSYSGDAYATDLAGGYRDESLPPPAPATPRTPSDRSPAAGLPADAAVDRADEPDVAFEPLEPGSVASFGMDGISLTPLPTWPEPMAEPGAPIATTPALYDDSSAQTSDIWADLPSAELDPEDLEDDLDDDRGDGGGPGDRTQLGGVARGGALNLVAALVYGLANFALLWVLNRELGTAAAGVVLVAIAAFNILARVAELGSATGLIRWVSRLRAHASVDLIPRMMGVSLVPVVLTSVGFALLLGTQAEALAGLLTNGESTQQLARVLAALAPLLPFAVLETVLVSATRGYDVMWPQALIEKTGRALLMPIVVLIATRMGGDVVAVARVWAATNLVALVPAVLVTRRLMAAARFEPGNPADPRTAYRAPGTAASGGDPGFDRRSPMAAARAFWGFSAPRAAGQTFEVSIAWVDTLLVSALVSTSAAGIYASGTRYVLLGAFISEAIMQVVGPRVSGLMARDRSRATSHLVRTAAGWQAALTWPVYLLVVAFAPVLLGVFGPEVLAAQGALIALSFGLMAFSLFGPAGSVILMSGKSSQAMGNAAIAVAFNLVGNLALVPWMGITGAGVIWALTLVLLVGLPAWQAHEQMKLDMISLPAFHTAAVATATVGVTGLIVRLIFGATWGAMILATVVGLLAYGAGMWRYRAETGLGELITDPAQLRPDRLLAAVRGSDRPDGSPDEAEPPRPPISDDPRRRPPNVNDRGAKHGR
ncbi:MAG: polysaccharide biosynthesis C-terminal domain-containing protein [Microthrixaceae bacterium]